MTRLILGLLIIAPALLAGVPLHRDSLPNGLVVLTYEDHRLPAVEARLVCRSGAQNDPAGKTGLARLTANLLFAGSAEQTAAQIEDTLEFLGARMSSGADHDQSYLGIRTLVEHSASAFDIIANAVLRPSFEPQRLERERDAMLSGTKRAYENPRALASIEFGRLLFPGHPYGRLASGDTTDIPGLTDADVREFHAEHYLPNNCFIVIVGDISRKEAVAAVAERFGDWQPGIPTAVAVPQLTSPTGISVRLITKPELNQSYVIFGHPGISITDEAMLSARLMSFILGGSALASRLGEVVREEGGLAYDVRCWFDRRELPGAYQATVQTRDPQAAIMLMLDVIETMHRDGPTAKELTGAQNYYTGSFPLNYSSMRGKLRYATQLELYRLGADWLDVFPDKIRELTLADLAAAAREKLHPGNYAMVIVSNLGRDAFDIPGATWLD